MMAIPRDIDERRLVDLLRYSRDFLFKEGLISRDEYMSLLQDHDGGNRVARLAAYDEAIAKMQDLNRQYRSSIRALRSALMFRIRGGWRNHE